MENQSFCFEVLVLDKSGQANITKDTSLIQALLYSESLWQQAKALEGVNEMKTIQDEKQQLELKIHPVDTGATLTDYIEAAFIVKIKGSNFDTLEKFRYPFLIHLRKLSFTNIRILRDDISTKIANDTYPLINRIECVLRRYLVLFFIQKIGIDWWEVTAPHQLNEKIGTRKNNEKLFSTLVDTDVTLIDFDNLGELVYKQTSGFNKPENLVDRVMAAQSVEELNNLKQELQGNYTKYFKEAFKNNGFEKKWKTLFEIRNKVAHNNLFVIADYINAKQLVSDLVIIVDEAESKINSFKFSVEEQVAIREASIEAVKVAEAQVEPRENEVEEGNSQSVQDTRSSFLRPSKIISEGDFLRELAFAEKTAIQRNLTYVGLKSFVTKILGRKGYATGPTYSLANILRDMGLVEIYDAVDETSSFPSKGIRIIKDYTSN